MIPDRRLQDDPLYLEEPTEYRAEFPVLGIPVRFATNDRAILDTIINVFGHWQGAELRAESRSAGIDVVVYLQPGDEGPNAPAPVVYRAPDPMRWIVHTQGSVGIADLERRSGVAYVTRALVEDDARFRVSVLHFMVLIILTIEDRTPVHAAVVARGDAALLLCGPAGSGKSTLAYAAAKQGMNVLSDDAAYVQLEPRRVWGSGPAVLLLREAHGCFPELEDKPTTLFPTGKSKMVVVPPTTSSARHWVSRVGVCVLSRSSGAVRIAPIDAAEVRAALAHAPTKAAGRFGADLDRAITWLSEQRRWKVSLSGDARQAVPCLSALLDQVDAGL